MNKKIVAEELIKIAKELVAGSEKPQVGDIWVSIYHYANSYCDFFKVLEVSGRKIVFGVLEKAERGNYNGGSVYVKPTNRLTGKKIVKNWTGRSYFNRGNYERMYPWDGKEMEELHGMD